MDIRNTMGLLFWGNFALATLVFTFRFALFSKENKTHLLVFGFSKIFQSFAWLAFFLRTDTVTFNPVNILITNTLVFTSYYLESVAMLMMVKDSSKKAYQIQFLLFIITLLSFYGAVFVEAAANIRVSLASIIIFTLLILPSLQFLMATRSSLFKKILGFNYVILLIVLVFRTFYPLFKTSTTLYSVDPTQKIIFLIIFLMMIISGVGYLLLLQEEKEMQVKKLLDDKDKFFSIIAHDLRGPFNGIIGLSELLLENDNQLKPKETNEFIQLIHQSSKNVYSLLENLLTWAQSQTGSLEFSPKKIEISPIINKTISLLDNIAKSKNIRIESKIKNEEYAFADKDMLETIFRNLISNAIKFTENNGEVQLSITRENNQIVFSVQDNGIGIPPEKITNLFAINHRNTTSGTNDETGTGLGLMLCKDFVKKHGGKIWVESEIGKGSNFKFSIPDSV
ncbi:sensor histidine kinase [Flavobacterium flevense]|uniref:sensor histidine kinase n=1 Tax=Flavobacterium flevense TaxID=983 RepID=UPI0013563DA1|nr:HAMP domain-containing sensor histidine kinase [Flavobacterium flevense]